MDPTQLIKQVLKPFIVTVVCIISSHSLRIKSYVRNQPNKAKTVSYPVNFTCQSFKTALHK